MNDENIVISAEKREEFGKNAARKIRALGLIPGIIIEKDASVPIKLNPKWLGRAFKNGRSFDLDFNGSTKTVHIQEVQIDKVKRTATHVDLVYK